MGLSSDLVSQFVQITQGEKEKENKETTVYGTIVESNGGKYVRLDGSDLLTPISLAANAINGERVTVMIKNHTAIVTGNISSPAARTDDVNEIRDTVSSFEIILADKVSVDRLEAEIARIDTLVSDNAVIKGKLEAAEANIDTLTSDNITVNEKLTAAEASIDQLETNKIDASVADIKYATIENLDAANAKVNNLEATYGSFHDLTTERLDAAEANIGTLEANKLSVESADLKYANINFANINMAAVEKLFAESGIIYDLKVSDGTITGELVGVTISGDLIKANTLYADKLVVRGSDGNYYKLNTDFSTMPSVEPLKEDMIHGSSIVAESITAEKINVDDLFAFNATIGGFNIGDNAIYSGVKDSINNTIAGIYLDSTGQIAFGDGSNYLKFYKATDEEWKFDISTNFLSYGDNGLELGYKKTGGKWAGYHTQINSSSFNILDANEKVLAAYGADEIHLGYKKDETAVNSATIFMCEDDLQIATTSYGNFTYSELYSPRIVLRADDSAGFNVTKRLYTADSGIEKEHEVTFRGYHAGTNPSHMYDYLEAEIKVSSHKPGEEYQDSKSSNIVLRDSAIDVNSSGSIHITCGSNGGIFLYGETTVFDGLDVRNGQIELNRGGEAADHGGYIDFHYNKSTADYTSRIIEDAQGKLSITASNGLYVNGKKVRTTADTPSIKTGTWTASLNGGTITKQYCTYMKVGNMCSISFYINGKGGTGTDATNFYITGAPYTPKSSATWYGGGCHVQGLYDTANYPVTGCVIHPNKHIYIRTAKVGGTGTGYIRVNNGGATFHLSGTITYPIA